MFLIHVLFTEAGGRRNKSICEIQIGAWSTRRVLPDPEAGKCMEAPPTEC